MRLMWAWRRLRERVALDRQVAARRRAVLPGGKGLLLAIRRPCLRMKRIVKSRRY